MFACIFFIEDRSLSVVDRKDTNLKITTEFKEREHVEMAWPCKTGKQKIYQGIIIKTGDNHDQLTDFANQAQRNILSRKENSSDNVAAELFTFQPSSEKKNGKRVRHITEKLRGSINDKEKSSSKKKKKKNDSDTTEAKACRPGSSKRGKKTPETPSMKKDQKKQSVEGTAIFTARQMINSTINTQFQDFNSTSTMPKSKGYDTCSLLSTWQTCQEALSTAEERYPTLPKPSADVLQILKVLLRPDVQQFLKEILAQVESDYRLSCIVSQRSTEHEPPSVVYDVRGSVVPSEITGSPLKGIRRSPRKKSVPTSTVSVCPDSPNNDFADPWSDTGVNDMPQRSFLLDLSTFDYSRTSTPASCSSNALYETRFSGTHEPMSNHYQFGYEHQQQIVEQSPSQLQQMASLHHQPLLTDSSSSLSGNGELAGTVRLLQNNELRVTHESHRKATLAAKKSVRPGFTLVYKLMEGVFSVDEMALSRGQGIGKKDLNDLRPALNSDKISTLKSYVTQWCRRNSLPVPREAELNDAITERISYARKQLKRMRVTD